MSKRPLDEIADAGHNTLINGFYPYPELPPKKKLQTSQRSYVVKRQEPLKIKGFTLKFKEREVFIGKETDNHLTCGDYTPAVDAAILGVEDKMHSGEPIELGHVRAHVIQFSRMRREGIKMREPWQQFSVWHQGWRDYTELEAAFMDDEGLPKAGFEGTLGTGDLLYVESVWLKPEYRGYGIGLLAVDGVIKSLPSFGQDTVIVPTALVWKPWHGKPSSAQHAGAAEKLEPYWKLLGFKTWAPKTAQHTSFMGLWTGVDRPSMEDVVPHLMDVNIESDDDE